MFLFYFVIQKQYKKFYDCGGGGSNSPESSFEIPFVYIRTLL
jgi:hypothetical protein